MVGQYITLTRSVQAIGVLSALHGDKLPRTEAPFIQHNVLADLEQCFSSIIYFYNCASARKIEGTYAIPDGHGIRCKYYDIKVSKLYDLCDLIQSGS